MPGFSEFVVRPFNAGDESELTQIRRICYETGDLGNPVREQWGDEASFAGMFTEYAVSEPESAFVAVRQAEDSSEEIVGYLLGCLDAQHARQPEVVFQQESLCKQGRIVPKGTAKFLARLALDVPRDLLLHGTAPSKLRFTDYEHYPADFHIDLLPEVRGRGIGSALMKNWVSLLLEKNIPGCHLRTTLENTAAVQFFGKHSFVPFGDPVLEPGMRHRDGTKLGRVHLLSMVRPL